MSELNVTAPELYEALEQTNRELHLAIEKVNELLSAQITATDMDPPDYWDGQTFHENAKLLAKARGEHV